MREGTGEGGADGAGVLACRNLIGGEWVDAADGARLDSVNPFDQSVWATIPRAGERDVADAIAAARKAFDDGWGRRPGHERAACMMRLADLLVRDADRLGRLETTDNGKVIRETSRQVLFAARVFRHLAGYADKLTGETIPLDNPELFDYTLREPVGVVALVTPWNSPIQLLSYKLAPAMAAGCTAVVKPSEVASVTTLEIAKLAMEAGFPAGVINVVTGDGVAGAALTGSPHVDKVSFTGGPGTARRIAAAAGANLVPLTLELGGKSPNIVFADADVPGATVGALAGVFGASGQTCIAGSRLLVQRPVYDQVVEEVARRAAAIRLGNPLEAETEMGPVANRQQFDKITGMIEAARAEGARMVAGGPDARLEPLTKGLFITPTVFADVDNAMTIAREEVFGPVLTIIPFEEEEEAIAIANDSPYGLAAGVWTQNLSRAHRVARRLDAGVVWVNTYRTNAVQAPFGGVKDSGYGRERGFHSVLEYTRVKNVMIDLSGKVGDPFAMRT